VRAVSFSGSIWDSWADEGRDLLVSRGPPAPAGLEWGDLLPLFRKLADLLKARQSRERAVGLLGGAIAQLRAEIAWMESDGLSNVQESTESARQQQMQLEREIGVLREAAVREVFVEALRVEKSALETEIAAQEAVVRSKRRRSRTHASREAACGRPQIRRRAA
jgi:hypothetical protein